MFENDCFSGTSWTDKPYLMPAGIVENTLEHKPFELERFSLRQSDFVQLENCCDFHAVYISLAYILVNYFP